MYGGTTSVIISQKIQHKKERENAQGVLSVPREYSAALGQIQMLVGVYIYTDNSRGGYICDAPAISYNITITSHFINLATNSLLFSTI